MGKLILVDVCKPSARAFLEPGGRGVVADHHRIATEQLACIALQAALEAIGKEPHRRYGSNGQGNGHHQQAQLA